MPWIVKCLPKKGAKRIYNQINKSPLSCEAQDYFSEHSNCEKFSLLQLHFPLLHPADLKDEFYSQHNDFEYFDPKYLIQVVKKGENKG